MRYSKVIIPLLALSIFPFTTSFAQKRKKVVKKTPVEVVEPTKEEINFSNLLPSTAKIMFIDSLVVDENKLAKHMPISQSCGEVTITKNDSIFDYSYTNEFATRRYLSIANGSGIHKLYVQNKLGRNWSEPEPVELQGDFSDIICPYVMPDGITLTFAALGGEDNVGKHDIFYTVYDSDNRSFYRPQSLGLPFNSTVDDLYYIIDDFSNIGYLATKRRQSDGKVCIYAFVPTESRETYDSETLSENALKSLATLSCISDTQNDLQALSDARKRYDALSNANNGSDSTDEKIHFVINATTTYTKLSQFKSATNKERFADYSNRLADIKQKEEALILLREKYHNGDKSATIRLKISELEEQLQSKRVELNKIAKQIRNSEIIK